MAESSQESLQRWTPKRHVALVMSILKGEMSVQEAPRHQGLTTVEVEDWRDKFLFSVENALRSKPRNEEALKDEQIKRLKQKIDELVIDNDILKGAMNGCPLGQGHPTSKESFVARLRATGMQGVVGDPLPLVASSAMSQSTSAF